VTAMPCPDCARAIIQSGIKMVVTHKVEIDANTPTGTWRDKLIYSEQMFKEAGVECLYL
ncbi:MAG: cell division protein DedD, partial [Alphaproteobacteria bacterium]|nr:cell division protein DedD [Alphaproteobacteria bacterium]